MKDLALILLQADAGGGSPLGGLPFFALIILVMYVFFFRPQMKRQKEERKFQSEGLQKGMRVVTTSGIHAKILEIQDDTLIIESENSRLKIDRAQVSKEASKAYIPKEEKEKKEKKSEKDEK